jgi:hypothetical protein
MPTQIDNTTKQQIEYFTICIARAKRPLVTDSYGRKLSDNQVTVACATLGKLCQISLLPLSTEQHNTSSEIKTINLLNFILMSPKTHVQYGTKFLLDQGAELETKDEDGWTPLSTPDI